jgi:uncharacterized protein YggU (UPF0235/DUF167 family)
MTVKLAIRVQPGARGDALVGRADDGTLRLKVSAPAEGGRANRAVESLLAATLGVPGRAVSVVHGASSRRKLVAIEGLEPGELEARIAAALESGGE